MGTISTPGFHTLPLLDVDALKTVNYPVHITRLDSPQLVYLYAEDNFLQMSELVPGSVNFDNIKQFCMVSRQEEQLLYSFCRERDVTVLCEVRAAGYNLVDQQVPTLRPLFVFPRGGQDGVCMEYLFELAALYWENIGGLAVCNNAATTRTVDERISLSLAVDLARKDKSGPGVLVVDSSGELYRAPNMEWLAWNSILGDLSEDLREGRLRRLSYPRVDECEEYYRECATKVLKGNRDLYEDIRNGESPLWALVYAVEETFGDFKAHQLAALK